MKSILQFCLASVLMAASPAAVTFTFDTDNQGIGPVSWNSANGGAAWSANHGGSLAITFTKSGWSNPLATLGMTSTPALSTEFNNARQYGGTLTFDFIVSQADLIGYSSATPPGWFELVVVGNGAESATGANDGWDQNVIGGATGYYGGIPAGPTTKSVSLTLAGGPPAGNNTVSFQPSSPWGELIFGINSQEWANEPVNTIRTFTGATIYIDNLSISANPVPEPGAGGLAMLAAGSLMMGRRRR
jgi:hypothetical protein